MTPGPSGGMLWLALEFGCDGGDVDRGRLPEQVGLDAVVGVDEHVAETDQSCPVD
jgi:hypothetical protein